MKALFCARVILLCLALCAVAVESAAQQLSLSGTVRDSTGVVPGATVVLSLRTATRHRRPPPTTSGAYRFDGLSAGSYELSFMHAGIRDGVRNVTLGPDTPPVDVVLSVGRVSTTLTVTAAAGKATATRLPVPNDDVPAQVSSIPQELMRQQGSQHHRRSAEECVRRAGGPLVWRVRAVHDPRLLRSRP